MPKSRPTNVDEVLEYLSSLVDILHKMVDMNLDVMARMSWLADRLELRMESMESLEDAAQRIHSELTRWEADITGLANEDPAR